MLRCVLRNYEVAVAWLPEEVFWQSNIIWRNETENSLVIYADEANSE